MPLRCQIDCQVALKKKTTKEKHNLDNKIKWKLKEQRIKNPKQKQRNKETKQKKSNR